MVTENVSVSSVRRHVRHAVGLGLLSLFAMLALGCARPKPSPGELLSQALIQYHGHLIFERFDEAAGFVPVEQRTEFMDYYEEQQGDLRITEFEVARLELSDDETVAQARVILSWYKLPSSVVHTSRMDQSWRFDTLTERWEVVEQNVREDGGR